MGVGDTGVTRLLNHLEAGLFRTYTIMEVIWKSYSQCHVWENWRRIRAVNSAMEEDRTQLHQSQQLNRFRPSHIYPKARCKSIHRWFVSPFFYLVFVFLVHFLLFEDIYDVSNPRWNPSCTLPSDGNVHNTNHTISNDTIYTHPIPVAMQHILVSGLL